MATTNDDMQKSVKAAEAESAKASETRVTASETTAPVNSDARAVAEPTAPVSKDAPAVANTQDAQPNLNAEEVQAEVDAELEALFAEADADEIPDAAQEVLLAQADDSADDAPAEEGEGEGESADGSAAGDGAMGAGQIGLIGLGLAAAAAAGGGGGSSSPSTGSSSEETDDITASTTDPVTASADEVLEVSGIPSEAVTVNAPSGVTFKFTGDAEDKTLELDASSVLGGDVVVENGTVDVSLADVSAVTSFTANSSLVITPTQLEALLDSTDSFSISSVSSEESTFTFDLRTDADVEAYNELVAEGGLIVSGSGADSIKFGVTDANHSGDADAETAAATELPVLIQNDEAFTLTTSADSGEDFTGTDNVDTFKAVDTTLTADDDLDGGASRDELDLTFSLGGTESVSGFNLNNIEQFNVTLNDEVSATGHTGTINFLQSDGVDLIKVGGATDATNTDTVALTNVELGTDLEAKGDKVNLDATYRASEITGDSDSANVAVNGVQSTTTSNGTVTIGSGIETVNLDVIGNASTLGDLDVNGAAVALTGYADLTVSGTSNLVSIAGSDYRGALDLTTAGQAVTSIETGSGADKIDADSTADMSITTNGGADEIDLTSADAGDNITVDAGSGDDTIIFVDEIDTSDDSVDGGEGTDTLKVTGASTTLAAAATITSIENLEITAGGAQSDVADLDNAGSALNSVTVVAANNAETDNVDLDNVDDESVTLESTDSNVQFGILDLDIATDGDSDSIDITVDNKDTTDKFLIDEIDVDNYETVNLTLARAADIGEGSGDEIEIEDISNLTTGDTLDVGGTSDASFGTHDRLTVATFDSSDLTGNVTLKVGSADQDITTGAGDDSVDFDTHLNSGDSVDLGAGENDAVTATINGLAAASSGKLSIANAELIELDTATGSSEIDATDITNADTLALGSGQDVTVTELASDTDIQLGVSGSKDYSGTLDVELADASGGSDEVTIKTLDTSSNDDIDAVLKGLTDVETVKFDVAGDTDGGLDNNAELTVTDLAAEKIVLTGGTKEVQTITVDTAQDNNAEDITVLGETISLAAAGDSPNATESAADIAAAINDSAAVSDSVTASSSSNVVTLRYSVSGDVPGASVTSNGALATTVASAIGDFDLTRGGDNAKLNANTTEVDASDFEGTTAAIAATSTATTFTSKYAGSTFTGSSADDTFTVGSTSNYLNGDVGTIDGGSESDGDTLTAYIGGSSASLDSVTDIETVNLEIDPTLGDTAFNAGGGSDGVISATTVDIGGGKSDAVYTLTATLTDKANKTIDAGDVAGSVELTFGEDELVVTDSASDPVTITGGSGDSDKVTITQSDSGTGTFTMSGVETMVVESKDGGANTIDLTNVTGLNTLIISDGNGTADNITVDELGSATAQIGDGSNYFDDHSVTFTAADLSGTEDTLNVDLVDTNGSSSAVTLVADDYETLNLDLADTVEDHQLDIDNDDTTDVGKIVVTGENVSGDLTLNNVEAGFDEIDASGLDGRLIMDGSTLQSGTTYTITGGSNDDTIEMVNASSDLSAGSGDDTLDVNITEQTGRILLNLGNSNQITEVNGDSTVSANASGFENVDLTGYTASSGSSDAVADVTGDDNDNTIVGTELNDTIRGEVGADTITGGKGVDTIFGGSGADVLYGDNNGTKEVQTITVTTDQNANSESVTVLGETVDLGSSADDSTAESASDIAAAINSASVLENLVTASSSASAVTLEYLVDGNVDAVTVSSGGDLATSVATPTAGTNGDTGNDVINGGAGADFVYGGLGNDTIDLGASDGASDTVAIAFGGQGVDQITNFNPGSTDGDILDFFGTSDVNDAGAGSNTLDVDGFSVYNSGDPVELIDGLTIFDNGGNLSDASSAGSVITEAEIATYIDDVTTGGGTDVVSLDNSSDVAYIGVSDGTNTTIAKVTDDLSEGNVTAVAHLMGVGDAGLLTEDNFQDFAS